jgi:hypothetical protein
MNRTVSLIALFVALVAFPGVASAQLPQCTAVSGWQQQGPNRTFESDNLFEYMDGNSEGYFLYGFVRMNGLTCKSGPATIVIDISEMSNPEYAYGMFCSTVDPRRPEEKIGTSGQIGPRRAIFAKDKYFVELAADPEGDYTATLRAFVAILEGNISGSTSLPPALSRFPVEDLVPRSVRLVPESVLGLRLLKAGYIGQYSYGKAFIVQEASPESAAQVIVKLKERFGQTSPATIADEGFTATDKYLGGLCMFRKGRWIGGVANLQAGRDGVAESVKLAAGLD